MEVKAVKERKVNETVHKFPTLALAAGAPQSAAEIGVNLAGMSGVSVHCVQSYLYLLVSSLEPQFNLTLPES